MTIQKRAATIQDISCFGRCSLTVALPLLSAAGIETCAIPTAVLSTHTGGFTGYTYRDLSSDIPAVAAHWQSLGLQFDTVYTGYLGSFEQLRMVEAFLDTFAPQGVLKVVDPAMADNGRLYGGFADDFPKGMAALCGKADVIVPNLTEAAFMLGEPFSEQYTKDEIEALVRRLAKLGCRQVVLTGVSFEAGTLGAAAYDRETDRVTYCFRPRIDRMYHGTGDVFASVLTAALTRGFSLEKATETAVEFTVGCIAHTAEIAPETNYGVNFEQEIPRLLELLKDAPTATKGQGCRL